MAWPRFSMSIRLKIHKSGVRQYRAGTRSPVLGHLRGPNLQPERKRLTGWSYRPIFA